MKEGDFLQLHNAKQNYQRILIVSLQVIGFVQLILMFLYPYVNIGQLSNAVAIGCIGMDLLLVISFGLVRYAQFWYWLLMYSWMAFTNYYAGNDIISSVGGWIIRKWLICGLFFLTMSLSSRKERFLWLKAMLLAAAMISSFCCSSAILTAVTSLLGIGKVILPIQGTLMNGRLSALGNSNTLGPIASVGCLASLLLLVQPMKITWRKRIRAVLLSLCFFIDFVSLGWSRSRGTMISMSLAFGVFVFSQVFPRDSKRKLLGVVRSFAAMLLAVCLTFGFLTSVKPVIGKCITFYSDRNLDAEESSDIQTKLNGYGMDYAVSTMTDRTLYWRAVIEMMDDEPMLWVTGLTPRRYKTNMITGAYEGRPEKTAYYEHNGYVNLLFLHGIPGVLFCFALMIDWIICGIQIIFMKDKSPYMNLMKGLAAIAFMIMVNGMVENYPLPSLSHFFQVYLFFLIAGASWATIHVDSERESSYEV